MYLAAIDLGTTTIEIQIFRADDGHPVSQASLPNPGSRFGKDVISRMTASLKGHRKDLQVLTESGIYRILMKALPEGASLSDVRELVIAGNTVMQYLLTGKDPEPLSHAPFTPVEPFGCETEILGIPTFLPPCMHAFVGADITCAVLASEMTGSGEPSLLLDLGTNGEMALWKNNALYVTSTAAGPVFDRAGAFGSDLLRALFGARETGLIDRTGYMESDVILVNGIRIRRELVRDLQLGKAAVSAGITTLLQETDTGFDDISTLFLAGNFGKNLDLSSAAGIGLLPEPLVTKTQVLGNAALSGASLLLLQKEKREPVKTLASHAVHIDLGGNPVFNRHYISDMNFPE